MLLLGFGYLMTFLGKYGLGAVGFTMLLTATAIPLNIAVEYGVRVMYGGWGSSDDTSSPLPLGISTFIDGTKKIGLFAANNTVVAKSFEMPAAA